MNYKKDNVAFSASTVFGNLFAVSDGQLGDLAWTRKCLLFVQLPREPWNESSDDVLP